MVFIDGIGLGPAGPDNPLSDELPGMARLAGGEAWTSAAAPYDGESHVVRAIDATLGVEGLPQSGTGQATLFTGVNCAELAGRHYGPYPHSATRSAIAEKNVFQRVKTLFADDPEPAAFANAYPDRFFSFAARRDWWTVTTRCCLDANVPIRTAEMLKEGLAVSADITGGGWPQAEPRIHPVSEEEAGMRFVEIARGHRFTLFEYYLTDKAGHAQDRQRAIEVLARLDRFLGAIDAQLNPQEELLIVTSDHGNLEDLSTRSHTEYPVPLIARGAGAEKLSDVRDLTDVVPAIMDVLEGQG